MAMTLEQEREAFEKWYVENAFAYEQSPIGSRDCGLSWKAWQARAHLTQPAQAVDVTDEMVQTVWDVAAKSAVDDLHYHIRDKRALRRGLEAALTRALSAEKAGWRDMDSAPASGVILLRVESEGDVRTMVAEATCRDGVWGWMVTSGWTGWSLLHSGWTPTGWQPLPASPTPDKD